MRKCGKTLQPDRPQMTVWRTRVACWITKATNTHLEYVILIAFPLYQWLRESASILRYKYIAACLVRCMVLKSQLLEV